MLNLNNISEDAYKKRSQKIGMRLRTERKNLKLTQEELASQLNISSRQRVARWENGTELPVLSDLLRMCDLFGCEIGYLLCDYDCKTRTATDIQKETGLNEQTIDFLRQAKLLSYPTAINQIVNHEDGNIIRLLYDFLFHKINSAGIDIGNNTTITENTIAASYLLEISSELRSLRKKISGGAENGQH